MLAAGGASAPGPAVAPTTPVQTPASSGSKATPEVQTPAGSGSKATQQNGVSSLNGPAGLVFALAAAAFYAMTTM